MPDPDTSGSGGPPPPKKLGRRGAGKAAKPVKPGKASKAASSAKSEPVMQVTAGSFIDDIRALAGAALVGAQLDGSRKRRIAAHIDAQLSERLSAWLDATQAARASSLPAEALLMAGRLGTLADAAKNAASRRLLLKAAKQLLASV